MNSVVPEQPGDGNNQLENKQWFFAIKVLIGMVGWQREAQARRHREEGKTILSTDKSEIHRKAGEEPPFGVKKVKDFSPGHNHPIASPPLVCSCIVLGRLVSAVLIIASCFIMTLFAMVYLTLCVNLIWPYPWKTTFLSLIQKKSFYFLQNKRYFKYFKPQQPVGLLHGLA